MSTKTYEQLEDEVIALEEKLSESENDYYYLKERVNDNLDSACDALFVNDLSNAPGKLVIIDYWGNQVGEWTPDALREFMEGRLL